ncbi:MAG TPA: hypothetical protein VKV30_05850, partial [Candidatus Angelobacter sp.]|nr:hypothetical protein [Candidatus Angelobacter sp.]
CGCAFRSHAAAGWLGQQINDGCAYIFGGHRTRRTFNLACFYACLGGSNGSGYPVGYSHRFVFSFMAGDYLQHFRQAVESNLDCFAGVVGCGFRRRACDRSFGPSFDALRMKGKQEIGILEFLWRRYGITRKSFNLDPGKLK